MAKRKNAAAVALAKRRNAKLTPERRAEIARQAAATRWARLTTIEERRAAVDAANSARRKSSGDNDL